MSTQSDQIHIPERRENLRRRSDKVQTIICNNRLTDLGLTSGRSKRSTDQSTQISMAISSGLNEGYGLRSVFTAKRLTCRQVAIVVNMILLWLFLSMIVVNDTLASHSGNYEYFCKIKNITVMSEFSDGTPDTVAMDLGCTTVRPGHELLKINFQPVQDEKLRNLFIHGDEAP